MDKRLKVPAAFTAAFGAEAAPVTLKPEDSPEVHALECFHEKYRPTVDRTERRQLNDALRSELTDRQWTMVVKLSDLESDGMLAEQDTFVDELCRHFPGMAPTIRAVAYHLCEQRLDERGVCCEGDVSA